MSDLLTLWIWIAFGMGLLVGSFLNVVGLRFLKEESIVFPASHCPACDTPLKPWENIPVLSYVLLGGACRTCKATISIQYPLVELATGLLFAAIVWQFGMTWLLLPLLFLVANLVVIFITDLRESLIFQVNSLSLIPVGLIYSWFHGVGGPGVSLFGLSVPDPFVSALIAILGAVVFFEGIILLSQWAFGTEGFGHGDTHLMMGVGAFLGWEATLLALGLGFVIQCIPAIPLMAWQWVQDKEYVSLASGGAAMSFGLLPIWLLNLPLEPGAKALLNLGCMAVTLVSLVIFLRQMKHRESFHYMPLGPALILGSLVALFWGPALLAAYHQFL